MEGFPQLCSMVIYTRLVSLLFSAAVVGLVIASHAENERSDLKQKDKHVEMYKSLLSLKRREQVETVEQVWKVEDYARQYKAITLVSEAIFPILNESLSKIAQMEYMAGGAFPPDQDSQEVLGKVYENVLFFGDFVLRMPDITKKVYKQHRAEWKPILEEAMRFCNDSKNVITGTNAKHLHLMAQEMGLIPEDPDYMNPFRAMHQTLSEFSHNTRNKKNEKLKKKKKEKAKKRRGPKLRGATTKTEL